MRNASESASPPARPRFLAKRWRVVTSVLTLILLLASCQTAPPEPAPAAEPEFDMELELALLDLPVNEQFRVRFLPPLARGMPTGDFVSDLALEIRFFNVNPSTGAATGATLGSPLSTSDRTIVSRRDTYSALWFSASMFFERKATQYLRAEIRLPGGPNAPVCNQTSEHCLGYLNIYMFKGLWLGRNKVPEGFVPVPGLFGVLPISFKVLEEQAPPADNPPPASIDELVGVSGAPLVPNAQAPNCVSSFGGRPGQGLQRVGAGLQRVGAGLQRVGAVGGMFYGPTATFPSSLTSPQDVAAELGGLLVTRSEPNWNVVLFVVDDFGGGNYTLPAALFGLNPDLNELAPGISHGALVLHHLLQMAPKLLPFGDPASKGVTTAFTGEPAYWFNAGEYGGYGPFKLYIQTIDVGDESTDMIPARIRDAAYAYGHHLSQGYDLVVNMSFAVVPCVVLEDFENAQELATFEDYLDALADVNEIGSSYLGELDELVSTPVNVATDPLLTYLQCPFPSVLNGDNVCDGSGPVNGDWGPFTSLIHVAASGNYGNTYALYPAASEWVVSVGSLERSASGSGYIVSQYSNLAELAAPGGIFELATVGNDTVGYAGTSFAAPVVSLFLAADVLHPPHKCPLQDVQGGQGVSDTPDLATGVYNMEPFYVPGSGELPPTLTSLCIVPQ